jgi:hypothetical protein
MPIVAALPLLWTHRISAALDQREVALILDFIVSSPNAETRMIAAQVASTTRSKVVADILLEKLSSENDDAVRVVFFDQLSDICEDTSIERLWDLKVLRRRGSRKSVQHGFTRS